MKKVFCFIASVLIALSFFSCAKIDSSGWLSNLDDAKKAARAEHKRIFLFFSDDEGDYRSEKLKKNVFNTDEFISIFTEKYVLVNIDYSNSRFNDEQKELLDEMRLYELYAVQGTPYFLILSPEGYVLSQLAIAETADVDTVKITFDEAEEAVSEFEELLKKTKSGSKEDRLAAIDAVFKKTNLALYPLLIPLNKLYLSLDKNNSDYMMLLAYSSATHYFIYNKIDKACKVYEKLAKNKNLTPNQKQQAYYTAGYILASTDSSEKKDFEKVRRYLQLAYDANPDSEEAEFIKNSITKIQSMIDGNGVEPTEPEPEDAEADSESTDDSESLGSEE